MSARRGTPGAVGLAAIVVWALIALASGGCDDDGTGQPSTAPTARPEVAASEVVQQFVAALGTGDADALYAIQSDAYKQVCSREQFQSVATRLLQAQPLEGPAQVVVEGNAGRASLFEVQADGTREQAFVPLIREPNGEWRIAPPSATGCLP